MLSKDEILTHKIISEARKIIKEDPHLANYMLRDLSVVRDAGLSDLAWSMHKNNPCEEDVEGLIFHLEKYMEKLRNSES